jgi:hypothetical protein
VSAVTADLCGLEIAGRVIKLGEQGRGTGFANALGLARAGEAPVVLRLLVNQLARCLGQPFDTPTQPRDSLGFIVKPTSV